MCRLDLFLVRSSKNATPLNWGIQGFSIMRYCERYRYCSASNLNNNPTYRTTIKLTKEILGLSFAALCLPALAHAADIDDIDAAAGTTDWSNADFSGQTQTLVTAHNWGFGDNFNGATFANTTFNIGNGGFAANQPFIDATI